MENIRHRFFTVKYLEVLPKSYPCPDCGQVAKRNSIGERTLQEPMCSTYRLGMFFSCPL